MGPLLADTAEGGRGPEDFGTILCHGRAGNTDLWVVDLGGEPPHGADPGGFPPLDGEANNEESTGATSGWGMGVTTDRGGAKGGGD